MKVKISIIVEGLQMVGDEHAVFYNTQDGEVYRISEEEMIAAEDGCRLEDFPDWQQENIEIAQRVLGENGFIELPSKFDIHEYRIMERFCLDMDDPEISAHLQSAIKGKGAFGRFKWACDRFGILEQWYAYKDDALRDIAVSWCIDHDLEYEE